MAERERFELSLGNIPTNGLANRPLIATWVPLHFLINEFILSKTVTHTTLHSHNGIRTHNLLQTGAVQPITPCLVGLRSHTASAPHMITSITQNYPPRIPKTITKLLW